MQTNTLKLGEKQSEEYQKFLEEQTEIEACCQNPSYLLTKYAYIQERSIGQIIKWEPWDFQLDLLDIFQKYNEIVILKARQLGISWLVSGFCLWQVLFNEAAKDLFLSQGEEEAWEMLDKSRFIWQHLPSFLQLEAGHDTRAFLDFKSAGQLKALPSTDKAGRSTDATTVVRDELARHPYGKENFSAIGPTIDAGGKTIDLSTIDKLDTDNHFTERINKALNGASCTIFPSGLELYTGGESGAVLVFLGWRLRPMRQKGMTLDEWFETRIKPKYEPFDIEQEYPETLSQALSTPITVCRFDTIALNEMLKECVSPLRIERNGLVKIYKEPVAGRKYCFTLDPSEGDYDPSAGQIIDWQTSEAVALFHGKIPINEQALITYDLYERYNHPFIAPERNASGLALIGQLIDMGITNFYFTAKDKPGWWTSGATRPVMMAELAEAIRLRQYRMPNEEAIRECQSFVRTEKHPDGIAVKGRHDEFVFLWAIYGQIRKKMPTGGMKVIHMEYRG